MILNIAKSVLVLICLGGVVLSPLIIPSHKRRRDHAGSMSRVPTPTAPNP